MQASESMIPMRGYIEIELKNAFTGAVIERVAQPNVMTMTGRRWAVVQVFEASGALGWLALGTDGTTPSASDVALGSEYIRKAIGTLDKSGTTDASAPYVQVLVDYGTDEANTALQEMALFDAAASGNIFSHATYDTKSKTTSNTLGVTYTIYN